MLIVDDDSVNLMLLRRLISRRYDFELLEACDGYSALEFARSCPNLNLILLDVQMPDISGIEVCRLLKLEETTRDVPIILISAVHTDATSIREGLDAGADGYITKPVEDNMLQAWIQATLRISTLKRALEAKNAPVPEDVDALLAQFSELSHSVNNALQSIMAAADLLNIQLADNHDFKDTIEGMLTDTERIARLVGETSRQAEAFTNSCEPE